MNERDVRVTELVDRLGRFTHSLQFSEGLTPAQWNVLRYISRANRHSCTPGALAAYLNCTRGTVSQTLKTLEDKGLIERRQGRGDRRAVDIRLTLRGYQVLERDPLATIPAAMSSCSDAEWTAVAASLQYLLDRVQTHNGVAEFGECPDCKHLMAEERDQAASNRCGVTGDAMSSAELNGICTHFVRDR